MRNTHEDCVRYSRELTILYEDTQALFDQQCSIENNQAEAKRQHVVACADFEKGSDGALHGHVSIRWYELTKAALADGEIIAYQCLCLVPVNWTCGRRRSVVPVRRSRLQVRLGCCEDGHLAWVVMRLLVRARSGVHPQVGLEICVEW